MWGRQEFDTHLRHEEEEDDEGRIIGLGADRLGAARLLQLLQ